MSVGVPIGSFEEAKGATMGGQSMMWIQSVGLMKREARTTDLIGKYEQHSMEIIVI